ncbi:MAG: type VI secretion system ATPase TssH, partial [Clostridia bacterium]|nr:type VI secretion system ATPase TssH [Clostridia bacterium]
MSQNAYTQKSLEAINEARAEARTRGQQQLEQAHLLYALLKENNALIPQLVRAMGRDSDGLRGGCEQVLSKLPQVRGGAWEDGKIYVSSDMDRALIKAADEAKGMKDEYISVEHLFLGLLICADRDMKALFSSQDITREGFLKALSTVRGASRVTSDNPEETYDALKKYGTDLVDQARKNKLDPVIGRDGEIRDVIRILSRKTKNNPVLIG